MNLQPSVANAEALEGVCGNSCDAIIAQVQTLTTSGDGKCFKIASHRDARQEVVLKGTIGREKVCRHMCLKTRP